MGCVEVYILQLVLLDLRTMPVFLYSDCDTTSQKLKFRPHLNQVARKSAVLN
jgi:hypothetical protein